MRQLPMLVWLVACAGETDLDKSEPETSPQETPETTPPQTTPSVDSDGDGSYSEDDCDDDDATVFPGAPELCGDGRVTDCSRSDETGTITLDGVQGFDDLQEALDAAGPDAELLLCPGTYVGNFESAAPVALVSLEGAEDTVLDGQGAGSVLQLPGGSSVTGLTLTGGQAPQGGGLQMSSAGTLLVQDCLVTANDAERGGGLAIYPGAVVTLAGTTVSGNEASEDGGGLYVGEGASVDLGDSSISSNVAVASGGGVALNGASLAGGSVADNESGDGNLYALWTCSGPWGGGIYATGESSVTGTDVSGNIAVFGAGIGVAKGHAVLTDVMVHGGQGGWMGGAGIIACTAEIELLGSSEVYDNVCQESGAGLYAYNSLVEGGVFRDNVANWAGGGAVVHDSQLVGATVQGNEANRGGGVALWTGSIRDSLVTGNVAAAQGGAVDMIGEEGDGPNIVFATTVSDNQAPVGGAFAINGIELTVEGSWVWRNASLDGGAVFMESDGTLSVLDSDFGTDADDNLPADVLLASGLYAFGYGSFSCDETECF